ncbi:MAG: glutamate racemase [Candidatus Portnoybacteria bacterium]|nr:glutamate racemase [Candidatus Portnoybacteria bacterium]
MNSQRKKFKIGVFDSGFGGLIILRDIIGSLPEYEYVYLGDSARIPYGTRSQETVFNFTKQAVEFLFKKNCFLIVLACNTASTKALRKIQQEYLPKFYPDRRVLGVIIPAVEAAVSCAKERIGVIATQGSVDSGAFIKEIEKINPKMKIFQQACPLFVPFVEEGEHNSPAADLIMEKYLAPLKKKKIEALILGCTHYGIMEKKIKRYLAGVKMINEGKIVAAKLNDYLKRHPEIEKQLIRNSKINFYTTDLTEKFGKLGSAFFGRKIKPQKVSLE